MTDLAETLRRLYSLIPRGRQLGLERMQQACALFEHPEQSFECVHVGGTNGKGTVSALTASIFASSSRPPPPEMPSASTGPTSGA